MQDTGGRTQSRWTRSTAVVLAAGVAFAAVGVVAVRFEHEGHVRVVIAGLIGFFSVVSLRAVWERARSGGRMGAGAALMGITGALGALGLVMAVSLIAGAWGGDGVIPDSQLARVFVGESRSGVHGALGNPFQHSLGNTADEDCDVYEANPGLQGGVYGEVCYIGDKVSRIVPFR